MTVTKAPVDPRELGLDALPTWVLLVVVGFMRLVSSVSILRFSFTRPMACQAIMS